MTHEEGHDEAVVEQTGRRPTVLLVAVLVAVTLLVVAALVQGVASVRTAVVAALVSGAAAVTYLVVRRPHVLEKAWDDATFRLRFATRSAPALADIEASDTTSTHLARTPDDRYWYLPAAFMCTVVAVVLGVLATMAIWDFTFDDVSPWLLLAGAVAAAVLALMAVSYAPPGPNWVQRLAGVDGRVLLAMLGLAIVVFATLEYFDFQQDRTPPSDWWLALGAVGLLIGLAGTNPRPVTGTRRPTARAAIDEAHRANEFAAHARVYEKRASAVSGSTGPSEALDAAVALAEQAATEAETRAEEAERHARSAQELERSLGATVDDATRQADAAEASSAAAFAAHRQAQSAGMSLEKQEPSS